MSGRVRSVNVGLPREVEWRGRWVSTGIFKEPVEGPVAVAGINLDGDEQADLELHGGRDKAVYVYPAEHYSYWQQELGQALPWGMFGENLTVEGMPDEDEVAIGDRLRIGTATFVVTQPRLPCFKLGIRFNDAGMVRRFLEAARTGYYLRIETAGQLEAGDDVEIVARDAAAVPVSEVTRLATRDRYDAAGLRRVLGVDALADVWRPYFEELLEEAV
jgi:MOSC domain-containing protein YiiM